MKRGKGELLATLLVVLSAAATVATCGVLRPSTVTPAVTGAPSDTMAGSPGPVLVTRGGAAGVAWCAPSAEERSPEGNSVPVLPRFYQALLRLEQGGEKTVRVSWFGDSHTQPDEWTSVLRDALQSRFGVGGPGFLHLGWVTHGYRNYSASQSVTGMWFVQPERLVSLKVVDDGVFGFGGLRTHPARAGVGATVVVSAKDLPRGGRWTLAYRFRDGAGRFRLEVSGQRPVDVVATEASRETIQHVAIRSTLPGGTLRCTVDAGQPEFLGLVIEGDSGVTVDNLGLNSARYRSMLTWNADSWKRELARRSPDLVVLAFGTNESSDLRSEIAKHHEYVNQVLQRIGDARPEADCLVFGPIDRAGGYTNTIRDLNAQQEAAARSVGCSFWSAQRAMGGEGSMQAWRSLVPALGGGDGIHLLPSGYRRVGSLLARDVLRGYDAGSPTAASGSLGTATDLK